MLLIVVVIKLLNQVTVHTREIDRLKITFKFFVLEDGGDCEFDYLQIDDERWATQNSVFATIAVFHSSTGRLLKTI